MIKLTREFCSAEIEKAKPILQLILQDNCKDIKAESILIDCDLMTVCTIQVLMYIGKDAKRLGHKKLYKDPVRKFIICAEYMDTFSCTEKDIEIDVILIKRDYKDYIKNALRLMNIRL